MRLQPPVPRNCIVIDEDDGVPARRLQGPVASECNTSAAFARDLKRDPGSPGALLEHPSRIVGARIVYDEDLPGCIGMLLLERI